VAGSSLSDVTRNKAMGLILGLRGRGLTRQCSASVLTSGLGSSTSSARYKRFAVLTPLHVRRTFCPFGFLTSSRMRAFHSPHGVTWNPRIRQGRVRPIPDSRCSAASSFGSVAMNGVLAIAWP
jgi:hypothetical protein